MAGLFYFSVEDRRRAADNCRAYRTSWSIGVARMAQAMACNPAAIEAIEKEVVLPARFNELVGRVLYRRREAPPKVARVRWEYVPGDITVS